MRWLLDQGLPRAAAILLRGQNMDAVHVGDIGMAGASKPSVIRIREEGLKGPAICHLILRLWGRFSEALDKGCVLTATLNQARLRLLPIHT
jgi:hypothetical protein